MAMKPSDELFYAKRYYWHKTNGSTITNVRVGRRTLGGIVTKVGNYKDPLNHAFTSVKWRGMMVKRRAFIGGRLWETEDGPSGTPYEPGYLFPSGFRPDALSRAINEAYDKLRGNIDVSIDLVQWRATLRMIGGYRGLVRGLLLIHREIASIERRIATLERQLKAEQGRRGARMRRIVRELNELANLIAAKRLEYVYGWAPTAQTITDLAVKCVTPDPGLLVCEGRGREITESLKKQFSMSSKVPIVHKVRISDRARVVLFFNPPSSVLAQLGTVSTLNPVGIAYEATPFSFVLDWFWDFGTWVRSLETAFLHGNDFVDGYQSVGQLTIVGSTISGTESTSDSALKQGTFTTWYGTGDARQARFSRTRLSVAPRPARPTTQFQFGSGRLLNAIALTKVVLLRGDSLAGRKW